MVLFSALAPKGFPTPAIPKGDSLPCECDGLNVGGTLHWQGSFCFLGSRALKQNKGPSCESDTGFVASEDVAWNRRAHLVPFNRLQKTGLAILLGAEKGAAARMPLMCVSGWEFQTLLKDSFIQSDQETGRCHCSTSGEGKGFAILDSQHGSLDEQ